MAALSHLIGTTIQPTYVASQVLPADESIPGGMVNVLVNGWPQTTNEYLRSVAEQFGPVVSVNVHAKGRAFVLFGTTLAAQEFIANVRRVRMEDPRTRSMQEYAVKAHTSPHRGSVPNRSIHIRNIPSLMRPDVMRAVLEQVVGEIEVFGGLVPQPGEDLTSLQVTFHDIPTQRAREALSDLRVLPFDNFSDVLLATPLVVKYNELASTTRERRYTGAKLEMKQQPFGF